MATDGIDINPESVINFAKQNKDLSQKIYESYNYCNKSLKAMRGFLGETQYLKLSELFIIYEKKINDLNISMNEFSKYAKEEAEKAKQYDKL
jgi:hypothetical protein